MEAKINEFICLVQKRNEHKCIDYINKYNDFYDAEFDNCFKASVLQTVCANELDQVAITLIDKKCNLTHQDISGFTPIMYASCYGLQNVVTHMIDNLADTATRKTNNGTSEMMYLCQGRDVNNIIKMIDRGYDIYYENDSNGENESLWIRAIIWEIKGVVEKLIDIDIFFADKFNTKYRHKKDEFTKYRHRRDEFYINILKYCSDKRDVYKHTIIATMNDASPTNALYQSFHTTYAVQLVDIICDFILLPI
ncbi:MAG: hypothetical protein Faunusvirus55_3 [Faunusvirus sp.]|jgi:hypothetical protein|uniref:Uncharacterized protein n=1 Tax=Faunusvirus sp. TaxID=2487766 RepID=A0A3G4ZY08_9VIRU|nr:MAG: hypothetical protein Faunusvirus55_3 [Faunusvirus sp.]